MHIAQAESRLSRNWITKTPKRYQTAILCLKWIVDGESTLRQSKSWIVFKRKFTLDLQRSEHPFAVTSTVFKSAIGKFVGMTGDVYESLDNKKMWVYFKCAKNQKYWILMRACHGHYQKDVSLKRRTTSYFNTWSGRNHRKSDFNNETGKHPF